MRAVSTTERAFCGMMLFTGVLVFSYITGEYIELLDRYKKNQHEYDEGDKLKLFFGVLYHFNNNCDIKNEF